MELTFWARMVYYCHIRRLSCLNPCCFGTYLLKVMKQICEGLRCSLNPCCFGTYLLSKRNRKVSFFLQDVLILVVLELTFWDEMYWKEFDITPKVLILVVLELTFWGSNWWLSFILCESLNPCCFGTYLLRLWIHRA